MRQASGGGCVCRLDTFFGALLFSIFSRQHSFLLCYFEVLLLDVWHVSPVSGLSGGAWHRAFRERTAPQDSCTAVRAACAAACCSSSERRCAAQFSKLHARRVKQKNEFGPTRAPENNDFWRPTAAKLPLRRPTPRAPASARWSLLRV